MQEQLILFAEQGRRGGVCYPKPGPHEGDTIEGTPVAFEPVGQDACIVTFCTQDGDVKVAVEQRQVPEGLAVGDRCTLSWKKLLRGHPEPCYGWWLSSVDSGRYAGGEEV